MLRDLIDCIRLEASRARRKIEVRIDHQILQLRFVERLDPRRQRGVAQNKNRRAVFARDAGRLDRDVKTIFHRRGRKDDARAVAVPAENGLKEIALLDIRRQAGARSAALHIDNDERHLRHGSPADRFGLERDAGAGAAGDGEISRERKAERDRDGAELVLGLHEDAAVFREFAPQNFHDGRPGRDGITGAVTHAGGDQAVGERLVAIHRDLRAVALFGNVRLELILVRQDVADGIAVAGLKRHERGVDDALVFAAEFFRDEGLQFLDIEMENFRDQTEDENVFAFVLRRSAERFDGQSGDRHADVNETFVVEVRLDVIRIVKQDAALFQKADVVLVTVLIKRDEEIGFIARGEDFAGAHADLENRRSAGDGGGNRHVGHDILGAASGQAREESAGALNAVLRISGEADDGVVDILGAEIGAVRWRNRRARAPFEPSVSGRTGGGFTWRTQYQKCGANPPPICMRRSWRRQKAWRIGMRRQ